MTSHDPASQGSAEEADPAGGPTAPGAAMPAEVERCSTLTGGQLEVLRLVGQHLSSKEIGARLGISPHTVDQRVRGAIRRLGISRRAEAARLVSAYDRALGIAADGDPLPDPDAYQRLIHQAPDIDSPVGSEQTAGAVSFQIRHADRTEGVGADRLETEQGTVRAQPLLSLPWSTPQQPINRWSAGKRLAAIIGIAIVASLSVGMFLAGLESLARMVRL